jgi:hypothetical protein
VLIPPDKGNLQLAQFWQAAQVGRNISGQLIVLEMAAFDSARVKKKQYNQLSKLE